MSNAEGRTVHCPISVIFSDGSAKTGEYSAPMMSDYTAGTYTDGIDQYVARDGKYMITPAVVQTSYGAGTNGLGTYEASAFYFGLKNQPPQNTGTIIAQIPQTGDPAASIWQWTPLTLGVACIIIAGWIVKRNHKLSPLS